MPDDQNKTSTIDDLVKELSKNNNPGPLGSSSNKPTANQPPSPSAPASQGPPSNLPGVKLPTADVGGGVKLQEPVPAPRPQPQQPMPPAGMSKPPTPSSSQQTVPIPSESKIFDKVGTISGLGRPAQEYKSSIRTMSEDIASLKSGQKPSGVDIPRKVAPEAPRPAIPGAPVAPAPTGPMSSIGLGKTERTGPLAGLPKPPTLPSRPWPTPDLGQAGKTRPLPLPPTPEKPPEPFKIPGIQPLMTVPSEKKSLSMTFYLLVAGILVIGGFLYWFLVLRVMEPEVVVSPIPTVTPTPVIKNLNDIFSGTPTNFEVALSENKSSDFKTFVDTLTVAGGESLKINLVQDIDGTLIPLNWLDMFVTTLTLGTFGLKDNIVILDSATLVYGQSEKFNEDGTVDSSTQNIKRTAFVARVMDAGRVVTIMKDWELTIAEDLVDYLLIEDTSKEESVNFLDNSYRGVAIRYENFPFPDITIDYAIVKSVDQNYLVIAGSREAMFATIDALLEQ